MLLFVRGSVLVVEGEAAPGTLVTQDANTIEIEADPTSIPQQFTVSVEGAEEGTQITAGDIALPAGVSLVSDAEMLVVNVVEAPSEEELEAEGAGEEGEAAAEADTETEGDEAAEESASDSE